MWIRKEIKLFFVRKLDELELNNIFSSLFLPSVQNHTLLYIFVETSTAHRFTRKVKENVKSRSRRVKNKNWLFSPGPPVRIKHHTISRFIRFFSLNIFTHRLVDIFDNK